MAAADWDRDKSLNWFGPYRLMGLVDLYWTLTHDVKVRAGEPERDRLGVGLMGVNCLLFSNKEFSDALMASFFLLSDP